MVIITHLYKKVNSISQARLYIGSEKAAVVYGGLAYLASDSFQRFSAEKKILQKKWIPEDEC
jgi:hypothetical protein